MSSRCTHPGCVRKVNAAGLCATHRRRKRLGLPMDAPIRMPDITDGDVLAAAYEVLEAPGDDDKAYLARRARFERVLRRYAEQERACR